MSSAWRLTSRTAPGRPVRLWQGLAGVLVLVAGGGHARGEPARPGRPAVVEDGIDRDETIGVATREADGTLVLHLRTPSDSGMAGDAIVRYRPDDPDYALVARHVGPLPAGKSVFVKRFGG